MAKKTLVFRKKSTMVLNFVKLSLTEDFTAHNARHCKTQGLHTCEDTYCPDSYAIICPETLK